MTGDPLTSEQREREAAIYAAIRLCMGNEDLSTPADLIDIAEYIRTGAKPEIPAL